MKLTDIKSFFNGRELPKQVTLSQCEVIVDVEKFVVSHISALESNPGNKTYLPYYKRLIALIENINNN